MATVAAAFPFVEVTIDTSALQPVAQRSPGVLAIVGTTASGANGGAAAPNVPTVVSTLDDAATLFSKVTNGVAAQNPLYSALQLALLQNPRPSKLYGVRAGADVAPALAALEAADDVTFVVLAATTDVGKAAAGADPATGLTALKNHVENMSAGGNKRIGVGMIDPAKVKTATYVADTVAAVESLRSSTSRMVLVAARGATQDAAVAAAAAIAGYAPSISIVLKQVNGVILPIAQQYGPSEITGLSEAGILPLIDPALIVGESVHFADGRCFTSSADLLFVDLVRTLDDIDFRLKAGLIGLVGDARITKSGLTLLKTRIEGILGPLQRAAVIDAFSMQIPALDVLSLPETAWSPADREIVNESRANRSVDVFVSITYGPATHRIKVTLAPTF
jgi:hypothetical protein